MRGKLARIAVMLAVLAVAAATLGAMPSQAPPEQEGSSPPYGSDVIAGSVSVQKLTSPGGTTLFACIDDCGVYKSEGVLNFAGPVPFRPSLTTPSSTPVLPAIGDTIVAAVPRWALIMGVLTFLSGVTLVLRVWRRETA